MALTYLTVNGPPQAGAPQRRRSHLTSHCSGASAVDGKGDKNAKRGPERDAPTPVSSRYVRRCPTLPPGPPGSTIGAERLSFRVRNVTGRFPFAMTAVTL